MVNGCRPDLYRVDVIGISESHGASTRTLCTRSAEVLWSLTEIPCCVSHVTDAELSNANALTCLLLLLSLQVLLVLLF